MGVKEGVAENQVNPLYVILALLLTKALAQVALMKGPNIVFAEDSKA